MAKNENIYPVTDDNGSTIGYVAEVFLYANDPRPEWYRVGVFGTYAAAIRACR